MTNFPTMLWNGLGLSGASKISPVSQSALKLVVTMATWEVNHRTRKQLAALSNDNLSDIGITRADANQETQKPFWLA